MVRIYGAGDGEVMVRWEPAPQEHAVETIAFASQQQVLSISAGLLHVDSQIDYTLLQGRMREALVSLPEGYSLLNVSGATCARGTSARTPPAPPRWSSRSATRARPPAA